MGDKNLGIGVASSNLFNILALQRDGVAKIHLKRLVVSNLLPPLVQLNKACGVTFFLPWYSSRTSVCRLVHIDFGFILETSW
ncbi:hypothetical protein NE237_000063 [Protea cynaroides]|uniref:Uncharacterized protein n=1 Tax=Protea cynaroides TaxID=273540 RepID=A0A9Q0JTG3_9MAGN|nr:hypothetical protein NE237_000063 [Protea cynaroides]